MADDRHEQAIDIVARRVLCNAARRAFDDREGLVHDYRMSPALIDDVEERVGQIVGSLDPSVEEFSAGWGFFQGPAL